MKQILIAIFAFLATLSNAQIVNQTNNARLDSLAIKVLQYEGIQPQDVRLGIVTMSKDLQKQVSTDEVELSGLVIKRGPGNYLMLLEDHADQFTFFHEMAHVVQYEHGTLEDLSIGVWRYGSDTITYQTNYFERPFEIDANDRAQDYVNRFTDTTLYVFIVVLAISILIILILFWMAHRSEQKRKRKYIH